MQVYTITVLYKKKATPMVYRRISKISCTIPDGSTITLEGEDIFGFEYPLTADYRLYGYDINVTVFSSDLRSISIEKDDRIYSISDIRK